MPGLRLGPFRREGQESTACAGNPTRKGGGTVQNVFILVPYQQCDEGVGNGKGPLRLAAALRQPGAPGYDPRHRFARVRVPAASDAGDNELEMMTALNTALATEVRAAAGAGRLPFALSGHCYTCLGVLAGLPPDVGLVWIDAHGDFNTPQTTPSGYLDGMGLAIATGRCHAGIRRQIGMAPIPETHVLHIAARDLDPPERENLFNSKIQLLDAARLDSSAELETLAARVRSVYLHIDLDVLDPAAAPGVIFKSPGGLTGAQLHRLVRRVARRFPLAAVNITGFNPDLDRGDQTLRAGLDLVQSIGGSGPHIFNISAESPVPSGV